MRTRNSWLKWHLAVWNFIAKNKNDECESILEHTWMTFHSITYQIETQFDWLKTSEKKVKRITKKNISKKNKIQFIKYLHALIAFLCVLSLTCSISFGSKCNVKYTEREKKNNGIWKFQNEFVHRMQSILYYCDSWVYENQIEHLSKECWILRRTIKHNRNDDWNRFQSSFEKIGPPQQPTLKWIYTN